MAINKPLLDDREYRVVVLDNGIEALLVQDLTTDKAAAALDVGVGSFADPPDLPGLAHFLEHLLFMGTEKYPSENEYSRFLTNHAGLFNAYTAAEHTNYHFEVAWPHLQGSLDRFAQFFISPLFSESCKSREIMAVDSENKKNLHNDIWRLYQLEKHLSNPQHPIKQFSTGNLQTLGRIPEEKGIDVRARLIDFYKQHYTSSIMKLVVIGREPLNVLETWVSELFSAVPNTHPELASTPRFYASTPTLRSEDLGVLIRAKPVMDIKLFELSFPVPDQQPCHETQPYHYYVHLLGHESKGSLLYYLKSKRWASELGCAISHICKGIDYLFVNIELTNEGMNHWREILEAFFAYIEMVRSAGPQQWIFEEIMRTSNAGFLYRQKWKAMQLSSSLAQVLHRPIPRERLLDYSVARRYDADAVAEFAKFLCPENMRAMLASQCLNNFTHKEKWYGTEYSVEKITDLKPNRIEELHLPRPNEFLPSNFELVEDAGKKIVQMRPRIVLDKPGLRLWHKKDDVFMVPKAHVYVKLVRGDVSQSARQMRLADLFTALVNDRLADYSYYADMADLNHTLTTIQDGFEIEIHGFSEKLDRLLKVIISTICTSDILEDRFVVVKEQQERQLSNLAWAQPASQRSLQSNYLLAERMYSIEDRFEALKTITYADFVEFVAATRKLGLGVEMLAIGNLSTSQAIDMAQMVSSIVPSPSTPEANHWNLVDHPRNASYLYKPGQHFYKELQHANPQNGNSAILVCYQFGQIDVHSLAVLSIISQILKEASFNQLRTKEQLGYIVGSNKRQLRGTLWFEVFVQSEESTQFLEERIENFVCNVAKQLLEQMSDSDFRKNVDAMMSEQLEKNKNLNDEAERYWSAINGGYFDFYRRQKLAEAAKLVTKEQILAAFQHHMVNLQTRSRLAIHFKALAAPKITAEVALSRAVGQLVSDKEISVSAQQIQQFSLECRGLSPEQAMQLLSKRLIEVGGLSQQEAQQFVGECLQKSHEMVRLAVENNIKKPIGEPIKDLKEYFASLTVAQAPHPLESLLELTNYETEEAKL